ncbi:hypothetical protein, partial [Halalkalibacter krulwichiae]
MTKWQNLIEVIQQQDELIMQQSKTIIELVNQNVEQEQMINELMEKPN